MDILSKIYKECDGYSFVSLVIGVSGKENAVLLHLRALRNFYF